MTRWSLFLQTLSLLHHFLGLYSLGAIGGLLAKQALLQCLKLEDEVLEEEASAALKSLDFNDDPMAFRFQP